MPSDNTLRPAAERFVAAIRTFEAESSAAAADAVIAARLGIQECFIQAGWVPPRPRQEEMARDRLILQQRVGTAEAVDELIGS